MALDVKLDLEPHCRRVRRVAPIRFVSLDRPAASRAVGPEGHPARSKQKKGDGKLDVQRAARSVLRARKSPRSLDFYCGSL